MRLPNSLPAETRPGDVVLVMSNGSFDGLCGKLLAGCRNAALRQGS